ncbi:pyridoxamine 5'-phosphate oxidase family protein [Pseudonocardia sp. DLS-67]
MSAPRTRQQRKQDTLTRLRQDVDAWVATGGDGLPYLVPLSFLWDGETLLIATAAASPTARNLRETGRVRIGIGPSRDVVLVDGVVQALAMTDLPEEVGDAFAAKTGFDPRRYSAPYLYFRVRPRRVQAWREVDEHDGRDLMRDGRWLTA